MIFPENRITWRVTLAPDGEPILYDARGADGCYSHRTAVGRPELDDADRIAARFAFPLEEARP